MHQNGTSQCETPGLPEWHENVWGGFPPRLSLAAVDDFRGLVARLPVGFTRLAESVNANCFGRFSTIRATRNGFAILRLLLLHFRYSLWESRGGFPPLGWKLPDLLRQV